MGKSSSTPDPVATAQAQTQSNEQTAAYNAALNRTSQYTPYGSSVYNQTGTDSTGAPTWANTINLTPEAQKQLDNQLQQNDQLSNIGFGLANQAQSSLGSANPTAGPLTYSAGGDYSAQMKQAQDAAYNAQTQYLDPQFKQQQSDLTAQLANQGVQAGSNAYNQAQNLFGLTKQQAYQGAQNAAVAAGNQEQNTLFGQSAQNASLNNSTQAQALQQAAYLKTLPLNELNALRSGTQISNPTFSTAPTATAGQSNVEGDTYQSAQIANNNNNNFLNGLFGLGSAGIMASDRRLKRDIKRIGETRSGLPLYEYRYLWSDRIRIGVIAQDLLKLKPEAVIRTPGGFMAVNYAAID